MDKQAKLRPKQSATATIKNDENTLEQALAELDRVGATEEREAELRAEFDRLAPATGSRCGPATGSSG